jgi:hypothetical protein
MKFRKPILLLLMISLVCQVFAFGFRFQDTADKSLAKATNLQGMYVFSDCTPVEKYKYLGTVNRNTGGFSSGQYEDVRDGLLKKAKKDYPNANGIILILKSGGTDRADVIQFE